MTLNCNLKPGDGEEGIVWTKKDFSTEKSTFTLVGKTKDACPTVDLGLIFNFLDDNKLIFIPILGLFGLFFAFFGFKSNKLTFFMTGFLAVVGLCMMFAVQFILNADTKPKTLWIVLFVSVMFGLVAGYFL